MSDKGAEALFRCDGIKAPGVCDQRVNFVMDGVNGFVSSCDFHLAQVLHEAGDTARGETIPVQVRPVDAGIVTFEVDA